MTDVNEQMKNIYIWNVKEGGCCCYGGADGSLFFTMKKKIYIFFYNTGCQLVTHFDFGTTVDFGLIKGLSAGEMPRTKGGGAKERAKKVSHYQKLNVTLLVVINISDIDFFFFVWNSTWRDNYCSAPTNESFHSYCSRKEMKTFRPGKPFICYQISTYCI